jgi:hypothetical protein
VQNCICADLCKIVLCLLQGVDLTAIIDDIRRLKIVAKGHERRIKTLEEKLALYEHRDVDNHD